MQFPVLMPAFQDSGFTWTPKACKIIAFMAVVMGFGFLFYMLLGFRWGLGLGALRGPGSRSLSAHVAQNMLFAHLCPRLCEDPDVAHLAACEHCPVVERVVVENVCQSCT